MTEARARNLCDLLKRLIEQTELEIRRKEQMIVRLDSQIQKLMSQPQPDTDLIQALKEESEGLQQTLETDRSQLQVMQEEFSAVCL